jgi:hypothetical protein
VFTLFLLACSTAFGQIEVGFIANDGVTQYCDYEVLLLSPVPYASGIHVLRDCGLPYDATLVGFKGNIAPSTGLPVTGGEIYLLADNIADTVCGCFTGEQAMLVTRTVPHPPKTWRFGWEYFVNTYESFNEYLTDWGYLTNTLGTGGPEGATRSGEPQKSFRGSFHEYNMTKK